MYVVEMRDYSEQDKEHLGRVRLLEDTDGDGRFDRATVFAEKLSWPTAIACWDGGVFVGAAPDIYYLKDHRRRRQGRRTAAGVHRLLAQQRAGAVEQLPVGARQSHSRRDQHQRRTDSPAGRSRLQALVAGRARFLVRSPHAGRACRERRCAARHDVRRLGAQVRLLQQRPYPDGDVRGSLPGAQSQRGRAGERGRALPPTARRPRCFAPVPSSPGASCARGCA